MSDEPKRGAQGEFEAAERAHGTHGKGDVREHEIGEKVPEPATREAREQSPRNLENAKEKLEGKLSDDGWGSAAAGGSSIDARPQKHEGSGGT